MGRSQGDKSERVVAPDPSGRPLAELLSLKGRGAAVTGGARGIGLAIARRLAEAGAAVCIGDLDLAAAEAAASSISSELGAEVHGRGLDVRQTSSVDRFADAAVEVLPGLDVWVNNAAIYPSAALVELGDAELEAVLDVDLAGMLRCARAAARAMLAVPDRCGKAIVNIASISGLRGRRGLSAYVAAKHGVVGLTKAMALELGEEGIRVLGVAPSVVDTPGMRERRAGLTGEELRAVEELERQLVDSIPLGRAGVPDDVARLVAVCASDLCAWISGTTIAVDGGMTAA